MKNLYKAVLNVYSTPRLLHISILKSLITIKHGTKNKSDIAKVLLLKRVLLTLVTEIHLIYRITLPYLFLTIAL